MHILVVHQYFLGKHDAGGSRWNQFAKYWAQADHKVSVLAGTVHYATGKKLPQYRGRYIVREKEDDNIDVFRCHVSESYNKSFLGRFWAYISFAISSIWAGLFHAKKADILICTSPPLTVALTGIILKYLLRIPLVFEVRDLWPESAIDTGVLANKHLIKLSYALERAAYRHADWINVLTPAFKTALIERKHIPAEKISMIPNGADLDIFKPGPLDNWVREKHSLGNKFVVTYVGAHGVANHLTQLLEAARILQVQDPNVVIMLVGDGMEKASLKQQADTLNLSNVCFVDAVPKHEIVDYIAASNVCTAVLKKIDTFKTVYPNKMFDYMSAARPIILAIDGVARELVEQAQAGVFVEPENPEQFALKVLDFKNNPEHCQQMAKNGLAYVQKYYSREALGHKYLDILTSQLS